MVGEIVGGVKFWARGVRRGMVPGSQRAVGHSSYVSIRTKVADAIVYDHCYHTNNSFSIAMKDEPACTLM